MQTKLLKYLFRGNNVELTANCTFDFIARVLIRTNSYKQTVNRWGARTARKWPAVFRSLGICNYANSASISISTRKAKATSSASRRKPVVIFDREAPLKRARGHAFIWRQKLKVLRFSREKAENARISDTTYR